MSFEVQAKRAGRLIGKIRRLVTRFDARVKLLWDSETPVVKSDQQIGVNALSRKDSDLGRALLQFNERLKAVLYDLSQCMSVIDDQLSIPEQKQKVRDIQLYLERYSRIVDFDEAHERIADEVLIWFGQIDCCVKQLMGELGGDPLQRLFLHHVTQLNPDGSTPEDSDDELLCSTSTWRGETERIKSRLNAMFSGRRSGLPLDPKIQARVTHSLNVSETIPTGVRSKLTNPKVVGLKPKAPSGVKKPVVLMDEVPSLSPMMSVAPVVDTPQLKQSPKEVKPPSGRKPVVDSPSQKEIRAKDDSVSVDPKRPTVVKKPVVSTEDVPRSLSPVADSKYVAVTSVPQQSPERVQQRKTVRFAIPGTSQKLSGPKGDGLKKKGPLTAVKSILKVTRQPEPVLNALERYKQRFPEKDRPANRSSGIFYRKPHLKRFGRGVGPRQAGTTKDVSPVPQVTLESSVPVLPGVIPSGALNVKPKQVLIQPIKRPGSKRRTVFAELGTPASVGVKATEPGRLFERVPAGSRRLNWDPKKMMWLMDLDTPLDTVGKYYLEPTLSKEPDQLCIKLYDTRYPQFKRPGSLYTFYINDVANLDLFILNLKQVLCEPKCLLSELSKSRIITQMSEIYHELESGQSIECHFDLKLIFQQIKKCDHHYSAHKLQRHIEQYYIPFEDKMAQDAKDANAVDIPNWYKRMQQLFAQVSELSGLLRRWPLQRFLQRGVIKKDSSMFERIIRVASQIEDDMLHCLCFPSRFALQAASYRYGLLVANMKILMRSVNFLPSHIVADMYGVRELAESIIDMDHLSQYVTVTRHHLSSVHDRLKVRRNDLLSYEKNLQDLSDGDLSDDSRLEAVDLMKPLRTPCGKRKLISKWSHYQKRVGKLTDIESIKHATLY
jgi:hypothetical protein